MARRTNNRTAAPGDKIRGELVSFRVRSADFWGTGVVRTRHDGGDVAIVGKVVGAREGDTIELEGELIEHPRYGAQFKIRSCEVVLPSDASGVIGWLSAKLPQISRRRAEALVAQHGVEGLWAVLDAANIEALCAVDGITPTRAEEILAAYQEHKAERDRMVRLKTWGLSDNQIARVLTEWGEEAEARMEENPYALMECVKGFGWERSDQVARKMGIAMDASPRLAAGIMHAMGEAVFAGHCYVAQGKLAKLVAEKVCGVDEQLVRRVLDDMLYQDVLVRLGPNIYLPKLAKAEGRLAKAFAVRVRSRTAGRAA